MTMAQDQRGLLDVFRTLDDAPTLTYTPSGSYFGAFALGSALVLAAVAATGGGVAPAVAVPVSAEQIAIGRIRDAAEQNTAASQHLAATNYAAAGVTGVTDANVAAINSALDSSYVTGAQADTASEVQTIVDAYNAILASADGNAGNTAPPLDGLQYAAVGVIVNGVAVTGNTLSLLDSVVDISSRTAVDTVPELQAFATAASHVIAAAAGGNPLTAAELTLLGITGVDGNNLASVNASIAATADDGSGVNTRDALQSVVSGAVGSHPVLSLALDGVTNVEVTSNLVFTANQTVIAGSGSIHIIDKGGLDNAEGTKGYHNDTSTNNQEFTVQQAMQSGILTISGTGTHTTITINPKWDLDLSSNYEVSIDDGAFLNANGSGQALHFNTVSFTTVTPGNHTATGSISTDAHASQTMTDTGGLTAGKNWLDIQGIGNNTGAMTQLGDLSVPNTAGSSAYALVMKNYATIPAQSGFDGISTGDTNIGVDKFGENDILYFDAQTNGRSNQVYDPSRTVVVNGLGVGGKIGQNALDMGVIQGQNGSLAVISLGLEGNTNNTLFNGIVHVDVDGFAETYHRTNPPVIMG